MIVSLLSQNVQGLNDSEKLDTVKNYYKSHLRKVDVICVQELKLRGDRLYAIKDTMWQGAVFFFFFTRGRTGRVVAGFVCGS